MTIKGLQKLTLLDYPATLAAIVFAGGCNFRCPFCHNGTLVVGNEGDIDTEQIFSFLESRKTKLGGVVISGGEPTIYPDLPDFIRRIRSLGYKVKLDTNGTNPDMIKALVGEGLARILIVVYRGESGDLRTRVVSTPFDWAESVKRTSV